MSDIWASAFWIGVLVSTVRIATPLLLAALGELIAESSGILNLSIEGTVTLGAFTGFLVTFESNNLWLGLFAAAAGGAGIALIMAFMAATVKVNQIVAGLALNILGIGLAFFLVPQRLSGRVQPGRAEGHDVRVFCRPRALVDSLGG